MVILEQKYSDLNTYLNPCFNLRKEEEKKKKKKYIVALGWDFVAQVSA